MGQRGVGTEKWRKLHNEELNDLYCSNIHCSGDKIEKNEMGEACSAYGGEERHIQGFSGKTWRRERDNCKTQV